MSSVWSDAVTETRFLYRPAGVRSTARTTQAVVGILIYAVGLVLFGFAVWQVRRTVKAGPAAARNGAPARG